MSLPRLCPTTGNFSPLYPISDQELIQLLCAFRITFPHIGIVLSTRERLQLRDVLALLGSVTHMSAGSHTGPGGYTGQGTTRLHRTTAHGISAECSIAEHSATEQFSLADSRSSKEVSQRLIALGLDPIWKDWDAVNSSAI